MRVQFHWWQLRENKQKNKNKSSNSHRNLFKYSLKHHRLDLFYLGGRLVCLFFVLATYVEHVLFCIDIFACVFNAQCIACFNILKSLVLLYVGCFLIVCLLLLFFEATHMYVTDGQKANQNAANKHEKKLGMEFVYGVATIHCEPFLSRNHHERTWPGV